MDTLVTLNSTDYNNTPMFKFPVKTVIEINDEIDILLTYGNIDFNLIKKLNVELNTELIQQVFTPVKSNVAIASAITSYARIEMMKYKTIPDVNVFYSDTDSIFIDKELPKDLVGNELGQMKDELNGDWIKEAYFLGIKKYAYKDGNGNVKTVFSGVPRDSLAWADIVKIASGEVFTKTVNDQFYKSLSKLQISIKSKSIEITNKTDKELTDNRYIPFHVDSLDGYTFSRFFNRMRSAVLRYLLKLKN